MAGAAPSAKPAPFLKPLDLIDRGILLAESSLSVVIVLVMVTLGVASAIGSIFGIQHPILRAAGDVLMHGTVWAAFLGASFATRGRKHLAIDALGRLLPDRARRVVVAIASTFGAVVAFGLGLGVYESLVEQAHTTDEQVRSFASSGILDAAVDRSYEFQFMIPAGFALIAIRLLLHGFHELLAAASGKVAPSQPVPPAPAADESVPHEEPDGTPSEAGDPLRVSPIAQAGPIEIGIAIAILLVPIVLSLGTSTFVPVLLGSLASAAMLGIPLALRVRKTGSAKATAPLPEEYATIDGPVPPLVAAAGVLATLALSYFGILNIENVSITMGVAFFAVVALMGAPLFTFLGGLALFLWLHGSETVPVTPLANAVEDVLGNHFARMSVLPTIPIFTVAGYLMSESKTPQRLVRVARALLGSLPGGLAVVCVLASAGFTVFSGASGITIVAIGGLLFPALLKDRYPEKFSLGLVTSGGALGITFFPCLPLLVYGIVAGLQEMPPGVERVQLNKMILAGILPGVLVLVLMMAYSMVVGVIRKVPRSSFDAKEAGAALWEAKWELALPIVVIVGLVAAGPLGAAAFTAFYVFVIEVFVYKDLSLGKDIPRIIPDSMVLVGAIFVKLCAATVLTFYFVQAQTADALFEALTCGEPAQAYLAEHSDVMFQCREAVDALARQGQSAGGLIDSPLTFLIALNVFLLIVGMLMDIFSAIVVIVPLIMGIAMHFGINPYHLGIVFLINLEIGYLMPPMGLNLFIAGFRFGRPVPDLYPVVLPFIGVFAAALMITTYVPSLSLAMLGEEAEMHPATPEVAPTTDDGGGGGEPAGGEAPAGGGEDCEVPREGESFEDFDARCSGAGAGGEGAPAEQADCDLPRENESFEEFEARCNAAEGAAAPAEGEGAAPAEGATPPDCDLPRPDESFEAFQARCGAM
ncbi:TRAP transporter large permease subunit [Sandaracinus amylolyticus]|uniref:TRAP-type C4-dicarboxylate transport system, large permease component n=1 Tax=Sandaracinus amylolyticus TaxID=927083 RepID=A0A0F6W8E1_9BACT|nr:TRAP transporter large permease subunit [Sandaracinus amylolyticus]AKF09933.1 TRAP-type C4-dicarboxylate transport system, large permease component [Sandaracinus amylolyticus]